jgi:hypothetical protein
LLLANKGKSKKEASEDELEKLGLLQLDNTSTKDNR